MSDLPKHPIPTGHPYHEDCAPSEEELAARATAPRVSQADVDAAVRNKYYHVIPDTMMTLCALTLHNGFTVIGKAACVSPANFRKDIGERLAREDAYNQLWSLLGFALAERLHAARHHAQHQVAFIARICHEVNRAYCAGTDDASQAPWDTAPQWQRDSAMLGVRYHLDNPDAGPEASHKEWMFDKARDGWTYGSIKDEVKKQHPCMVPYSALPRGQRVKDYLFRAVVHALR